MGRENLKPIEEQVVVITGASSGIGRETALQFAENEAKVVPIARSRAELESLEREIERLGGSAKAIVADVSEWEQVEAAAAEAADRFGRIDTWVNNAAVSLYATVEQSDVQEIRRLVDVIMMGQIYGMKAALPHLERQGRGAIINVASVLARRSVPLQAAYCASKHGVKGFSESLRLELEHEGSGVSVSLILPSSTNTPLFEHARSRMGVQPRPMPPVYEPRVVAEAILYAAEHRVREVTVGGAGKLLEVLERVSPRAADYYMLRRGNAFRQQLTARPPDGEDNLFGPMPGTGRTTGQFGQGSKSVSAYTRWLEFHPARKRLLAASAMLGGAVVLGSLAALAGSGPGDGRAGELGRREGHQQPAGA